MAKETVGLKIGASYLSAAAIEVNGSARLVQIAREPIPRGIVAGGEVKDVVALTEALKFFFKRHGLSKRNVRIGIANNRIGVRTIELMGIEDPKQVANAVRFRAQEALPIPVDQALLDYQVLGDTVEGGQSKKRVLLVVAYRELVDAYSTACRAAGIKLAGVDLEAFALLRALMPPEEPSGEKSALVAVTMGSERSTLGVSDGQSCEFARVIWTSKPPRSSRRASRSMAPRSPRGSRPSRPRSRARHSTVRSRASPASSCPRSSSTRASPTRSASAKLSSQAAPRALPASHPLFSALSA